MPPPDPLVISALEKARKELLELSTRNRLISIPQSSTAKLVRIHDELSEQVMRTLVSNGKAMSFDPAEEEDADDAPDDSEVLPAPPSMDDAVNKQGVATRHTDDKLQTKLPPNKLFKRLLSLYYDARTAIQELGVNTLYLSLGQIKWRESPDSDIYRFAPLVLLPVELSRRGAKEMFKLKVIDVEPTENLTLKFKLKEFSVAAPDFDWNEDGFNIADYFERFREAIAEQPDWEILPDNIVMGMFSFGKLRMWLDLDPANWGDDHSLAKHEHVASLLGAEGSKDQGSPISEDTNLDTLLSAENLDHVIDADSSKALVIEEIKRGRSITIQGPPGTGKSQTIAILTAAAALQGKTVLFVSEKLTAMDVVKRKLDSIGLGSIALELHSHRANKKTVLDELKRTLDLGAPKEPENPIPRLKALREKLNVHSTLMNRRRDHHGRSAFNIIGNLTKLRAYEDRRDLVLDLAGAEQWTTGKYNEHKALISELKDSLAHLWKLADHPWYGVEAINLGIFAQSDIVAGLPALIDIIQEVTVTGGALASKLGYSHPENIDEAENHIHIGKLLGKAPRFDRNSISNPLWETDRDTLEELIEVGKKVEATQKKINTIFVEAAWDYYLPPTRHHIATHGGSFFGRFKSVYRQSLAELGSLLREPKPPKHLWDKLNLIDSLDDAQKARDHYKKLVETGKKCFGSFWKEESQGWEELKEIIGWVSEVFEIGYGLDFLEKAAHVEDTKLCGESADAFERQLGRLISQANELVRKLALNLPKVFNVEDIKTVDFDRLVSKLSSWKNQEESLSQWVTYYSLAARVKVAGFSAILDFVEQDAIESEGIEDLFDYWYFRKLFSKVEEEAPQISSFDGIRHDQLVKDFREQDKKRIDYARYQVLKSHHENLPTQEAQAGALGVLRREMNKKRNHLAIRKLVKRAGPAMQKIKPVFMMGPLSVAQFLAPGSVKFDLVIFDEASQIEPVDAIGAIARGKQLAILGDEKQLPPTSFFKKMGGAGDGDADGDTDGDEVAPVSDIESILGLANAQGFQSKMLRWHYRSNHPSLIAVSNHEFYDNQLFIVPSPWEEHPDYGLKFEKVEGGWFDRGTGKSQTNRVEAKRVAEAVIEHAINKPKETLGVAAFSVSQRDAILDELELLRRDNPETENFFSSHPHERFFVKNLENVQGDQRDVIFISIGYASTQEGFTSMNFGPLNNDGGERRLNVLITRAASICRVFSSITEEYIDLNKTKKRGTSVLKTYLKYAEKRILGIPLENGAAEVESPFEASVKKALEDRGYEIKAQVGESGFHIDLAVVDQEMPGRYLLGIECDGATYHSSRSARERDRQRQDVLEAQGWSIHRIWSTDWFRQPEGQLRKVVDAIESRRDELEAEDVEIEEATPEPPQIEREDPAGEDNPPANTTSISVPYREASLPDSSITHRDIHALPVQTLSEVVERILRIESPIHEEEIITRIRQFWGLGRAGNRIRTAILAALNHCVRQSAKITRTQGFITQADCQLCIRDRSRAESTTLRTAERLPPTEIAHTVKKLISHNVGLEVAEAPKAVSVAFGIKRCTNEMETIIDFHIRSLVSSGKIVQSGQRYELPGN
jgi:very-short-patch-repair endonuclease